MSFVWCKHDKAAPDDLGCDECGAVFGDVYPARTWELPEHMREGAPVPGSACVNPNARKTPAPPKARP